MKHKDGLDIAALLLLLLVAIAAMVVPVALTQPALLAVPAVLVLIALCVVLYQRRRLRAFLARQSGHISGQGMIFAGFAVFYIYAETVSIRICCQHQISIQFFCHAKSQCESFCRFRIRITYGREIAIRKFLLRNHIDVLETKLF